MKDLEELYKQKAKTEHYSSFEEMYKSITKAGSLGLLAHGEVGLKLWRKKRAEIEAQEKGGKSKDINE